MGSGPSPPWKERGMAEETPVEVEEAPEPELDETTDPSTPPATEETPDKGKDHPPDVANDPEKLAKSYKELQAEYTRTAQERADLRRERDQWQNERGTLAQHSQALKALTENPRFKEWAEREILSSEVGNWEDLSPEQQLSAVNRIAEKKAQEIAAAEVAKLKSEYEPQQRVAAVERATAIAADLAKDWGELWEAKKPEVAQILAAYDQMAVEDPRLRHQMNNPTRDFLENVFRQTLTPKEIFEAGKKAYRAEIEKKKKAQISASANAADGALGLPKPKTLADAFKQAMKANNANPEMLE